MELRINKKEDKMSDVGRRSAYKNTKRFSSSANAFRSHFREKKKTTKVNPNELSLYNIIK